MYDLNELDKECRQLCEGAYSPSDCDAISRALTYAYNAHAGQLRKTGEPYIIHPFHVAKRIIALHLDATTVQAGLLHDVPEDTHITLQEISRAFGKTIAQLVDGVTKLTNVRFKKAWFWFGPLRAHQLPVFERQAETLRKMFMAMSKDIRVVFIKLADRLNNMHTIDAIPKENQIRMAQETLEIYAPIADRLGIGQWKGELEDLAFPYVYPKEARLVQSLIGTELRRRQKDSEKARKLLYKFCAKAHIPVIDIHGRIKHRYSFWKKYEKYDRDLSKIYDLVALRVIVPSHKDCYATMSTIHEHWKPLPGRIKDYIAHPKPNGYQSLHTSVSGPSGHILEIQIRTQAMHLESEYGVALHWHYAEQKNIGRPFAPKNMVRIPKEKLAWIRELAAWQKHSTDPAEYQKDISYRFFKNRIFVFTPKGDVRELPEHATPIDFAYAIHTEVGNHCTGAKVNGKMVKLDTILASGDVVEILTTTKASGPKSDWLAFVTSSAARQRIRSILNKQKRSK